MKLVIDIPEEYYKTIKETKKEVVPVGWVSIREGTKYEGIPRGEWISLPRGAFQCSKCECVSKYKYPFCHWCGSDNRPKKQSCSFADETCKKNPCKDCGLIEER